MNLYISTKENLYFNPFYPNTYATLHDISFVYFSFVNQKKKKKKKVPPPPKLTMSGGGCGNANILQLLANRRSTVAKTLDTDSFHFLVEMSNTSRQMWEQAFTQESSKETKRQALSLTETRAALEILGKRVGVWKETGGGKWSANIIGMQKNSSICCRGDTVN